jgi:hypothetical protein
MINETYREIIAIVVGGKVVRAFELVVIVAPDFVSVDWMFSSLRIFTYEWRRVR